MERIDESLTHMLERYGRPLSFHLQIDLCLDIALAIAYLHSNKILHRDLSSNNVLIVAERKAKVSDFGMSKLVEEIVGSSSRTHTMCPGTSAYMPPEALKHKPHYSGKIDIFSLGVLGIQMCTSLWPEPGPPTREVPCPTSPSGLSEIPIPETERRRNHLDLIDQTNPLLPIIVQCLSNSKEDRPSAQQLCQSIEGLQHSSNYKQSLEHADKDTTHLVNKLSGSNKLIKQLEDDLKEKEKLVCRLTELNQELEEKYQVTREETDSDQEDSKSSMSSIRIKWKEGDNAPINLVRGGTATNGNMVYFYDESGQIAVYDFITKAWYVLPKCPSKNGGIALVQGVLTVIGGNVEPRETTNILLSLVDDKKWVHCFPPMPTKRSNSSAVSTGKHLIVAGGTKTGDIANNLSTVEVMELGTLGWYKASDLPSPLGRASATICENRVYILGGQDRDKLSKSMFSCDVQDAVRLHSQGSANEQPQTQCGVWEEEADLPVYSSTCTTVSGNLLMAIGGEGETLSYKSVYGYNKSTNSWQTIGNMLARRYTSLVETLPNGELMVVGGRRTIFSKTASVQFGIVESTL